MTQGATANQGGALTIGKKIGDLRALLDEKEEELNAVLDDPIATRRLIMVALAAAQRTPKLLECTRSSILLALIEAGAVNLEPSGILGQAALVPFKNKNTGKLEAVFMPMYQGLIEVALRSEKVAKIEAHVVFNGWDGKDETVPEEQQGDVYHYEKGDKPYLYHKPNTKHPGYLDPDCITDAYAIAWLSNGQIIREPMDIKEIEKIKASSMAGDQGPWNKDQWFEMMCRKTPVKRIYKYCPKTPEMRALIAKDDSLEAGAPIPLALIDPEMASQRAADQTRQRLDELGSRIKPGETPETGSEPPQEQEPPEQTEAEVVEEVAGEKETTATVDQEPTGKEEVEESAVEGEEEEGVETLPTMLEICTDSKTSEIQPKIIEMIEKLGLDLDEVMKDPAIYDRALADYTQGLRIEASDAPGEPVDQTPTPEEPESEEVAPATARGLMGDPVEGEEAISLAPEDRKAVNASIHSRFHKLLKDVKWELDSGDRRRLLHRYIEKGLSSISDLTDERALKIKNHLYQDSDKVRRWLMDRKKDHEEGQSATE